MFVPTPCCMPGSVDEKQRDGVRFANTPLIDYLKHVAHGVGGTDIHLAQRDRVLVCLGNLHAPF